MTYILDRPGDRAACLGTKVLSSKTIGGPVRIRNFLAAATTDVDEADTLKQARNLQTVAPRLVILDYSLPDGNSLEVLPRLKASDPSIPILILHRPVRLISPYARSRKAPTVLTKPLQMQRCSSSSKDCSQSTSGSARCAHDAAARTCAVDPSSE